MTAVAELAPTLPAMSTDALDKVRRLGDRMLQEPQLDIKTTHALHARMYARTVHMPKHAMLAGVVITIPTLVIVSGHVSAFIGDRWTNLVGYHVIPAQAGRKQVFVSQEATDITMLFPTNATTVEDAENEFTNEPDMLMSRHQPGQERLIIGDMP